MALLINSDVIIRIAPSGGGMEFETDELPTTYLLLLPSLDDVATVGSLLLYWQS